MKNEQRYHELLEAPGETLSRTIKCTNFGNEVSVGIFYWVIREGTWDMLGRWAGHVARAPPTRWPWGLLLNNFQR